MQCFVRVLNNFMRYAKKMADAFYLFDITVYVTLYMYQVAYSIKKPDFYRVFLKTK